MFLRDNARIDVFVSGVDKTFFGYAPIALVLLFSNDFDGTFVLYETKITLCVEAEKVGAIGAVAIVRVPIVVVRADIVALIDKSSPAVVNAQPVDWIEVELDEVDDLPDVIIPVAIGSDDVGEL